MYISWFKESMHTHRSNFANITNVVPSLQCIYLDSKRVSILIEAVLPTLPMLYLPFNVYLDSKRVSILIEAVLPLCQHYQICSFLQKKNTSFPSWFSIWKNDHKWLFWHGRNTKWFIEPMKKLVLYLGTNQHPRLAPQHRYSLSLSSQILQGVCTSLMGPRQGTSWFRHHGWNFSIFQMPGLYCALPC